MKVGRKVTNYDITLTDKDITVLIECIQKAKLDNIRHQNHAEALLEGFVKIFLDDNYEKYVGRYLELVGIYLKYNHKIEDNKIEILLKKTREDIKDDKNYVFHYDPEDWSNRLANGFEQQSNDEDEPIRLSLDRVTEVYGEYADKIREELLRKPSDKAIERNKRSQELLRKLRR